ncbi:MAG: ribonuclease P protein component [Minisyncoccales bacterium]
MFSQKNRLRKKNDFDRVFKQGRGYRHGFLFLKVLDNDLGFTRFGVVVSKKISNKAVVRNKIKRQLREILKKKTDTVKKGLDIVFLTNSGIEKENFKDIEQEVEEILKKAGII